MAHGGCGRATAEDMNLEWFHRVGMVNGSFSSWRGLEGRLLWEGPPRELSLPESCLAQWLMGGSKYNGGAAEGMVSVSCPTLSMLKVRHTSSYPLRRLAISEGTVMSAVGRLSHEKRLTISRGATGSGRGNSPAT